MQGGFWIWSLIRSWLWRIRRSSDWLNWVLGHVLTNNLLRILRSLKCWVLIIVWLDYWWLAILQTWLLYINLLILRNHLFIDSILSCVLQLWLLYHVTVVIMRIKVLDLWIHHRHWLLIYLLLRQVAILLNWRRDYHNWILNLLIRLIAWLLGYVVIVLDLRQLLILILIQCLISVKIYWILISILINRFRFIVIWFDRVMLVLLYHLIGLIVVVFIRLDFQWLCVVYRLCNWAELKILGIVWLLLLCHLLLLLLFIK